VGKTSFLKRAFHYSVKNKTETARLEKKWVEPFPKSERVQVTLYWVKHREKQNILRKAKTFFTRNPPFNVEEFRISPWVPDVSKYH
jgi:hypothetical protein